MVRIHTRFLSHGALFLSIVLLGGCKARSTTRVVHNAPVPATKLEPIQERSDCTLTGKLTYDGEPPARADLEKTIRGRHDGERLVQGGTLDEKWLVTSDKGVKNGVIWLRALPDTSLPIPPAHQKWDKDPLVIKQPIAFYQPRVLVAFPSYWDHISNRQIPTGQKVQISNDSAMNRCPRWYGENKVANSGQNLSLRQNETLDINPKPALENRRGEDLVTVSDNKLDWMKAFVWVFDHPYAAVTAADGTYEIKAPLAGVEVEVVHWHESFGAYPRVTKMVLKEGVNEFSPKIKE